MKVLLQWSTFNILIKNLAGRLGIYDFSISDIFQFLKTDFILNNRNKPHKGSSLNT